MYKKLNFKIQKKKKRFWLTCITNSRATYLLTIQTNIYFSISLGFLEEFLYSINTIKNTLFHTVVRHN